MTLYALTLWQPWASLVAVGAKPYEFRGWQAPRWVRGKRIAIHAGARPARRAEIQDLLVRLRTSGAVESRLKQEVALQLLERALPAPAMLPHSAVVATAVLGEPVHPKQVAAWANDSDRHEHFNWAWPLREVRPVLPPVPATGAQGFWSWEPPEGFGDAAA